MKFVLDVEKAYPGYKTREEKLVHVREELVPVLRDEGLEKYAEQIEEQLPPTYAEIAGLIRECTARPGRVPYAALQKMAKRLKDTDEV